MTLIGVERSVGRAKLTLVATQLAPRVLDVDPDGARVALVATSALLLGGDHVCIDVRVGPGAWLDIVDTAGTVAYDAAGEPSGWTVRAVLSAGALLLWQGQPFVVAGGANVLRQMRIDIGLGAVACLRETVVLGRTGEVGGALRLRSDISVSGDPVLVEELDLTSVQNRCAPGVLGPNRVVDSVSMFGLRAPALPVGSHFDLAGAGSVARFLGRGLAESPAGDWWTDWRRLALSRYATQLPAGQTV